MIGFALAGGAVGVALVGLWALRLVLGHLAAQRPTDDRFRALEARLEVVAADHTALRRAWDTEQTARALRRG